MFQGHVAAKLPLVCEHLNADSHVPTNNFIDLMYSNGFYPLISKATRITSHSATLIDNISNDLDNQKFSAILWSDISDHLPIFQITNCSLKPKTKSSVYHKRLVTTDNIENFRSHLCSINWDFSQSSSSNALYNSFMDCLYPIYETCFPVKIITVKENSKAKPWFTSGLQNSCRRKYALYKQYCNNPTPANKASSLKSSNSEGVDGINVNVIKASIDLLASSLSQMCNISFSTGIVPDKLKISKVLPIFKSEDSTNFTNYRPISILPCFSKILESAMHHCLMDYLTKHSILNNHQYGFKKKHSTFIAILELTNKIFDSFEKNELTIGIFIDLKKAFDTVNHSILLDKLNFYGIRGTPFNWMHSYLLSRSQYVQIDSWKSPLLPIKCGVPQGSVLGPLLFLVDINVILLCSNYLSFIFFADDTNIFFQHKNISELTKIVNHELSFVATWFKANKLTLHPDKTKFILFHPPRKKINLDGLSISIDKNSINRVEHTKFLGVIIHQNLSWQAHIKAISSKIAKSTGIIIKSGQFFFSNTLCTLYNSLILPYLQYCLIIWASTYSSH